MQVTKDIFYVGVNDHSIDLFEGQYAVPGGMAYNSYVIVDEKIAVMDTVDQGFTDQWLGNLAAVLGDRQPDYLVVHHMEPDHSANIVEFLKVYPQAVLVSSSKAFTMMNGYFGSDFPDRRVVIGNGDTLCLGAHTLTFVAAPMVHWPEVMMSYDSTDQVLFSADGFGKFGALDVDEPWLDEARRYYIGIVGKYGAQVQALLKKVASYPISAICPLHGPVLKDDLGAYLQAYQTWSAYEPEESGVVIAYTSVYGHTEEAVMLMEKALKEQGCDSVHIYDLARCDLSEAVAAAFRYDRIVLATTTYNGDMFPFMKSYIQHLTERNFKNRTVGFVENGSWAPLAAKHMKAMLEGCKNLVLCEAEVRILGALNEESRTQVQTLAAELCR
ncbi:MAG: flavodoxin domain-containing protein [Oscillospiraceae bacterium]|nr:flavodoxin domain-containing protein [Oscillospiraceae bacterium]